MEFFNQINNISPISKEQWSKLESSLKVTQLARGELLLEADDIASSFAFVISGCFKLYYLAHSSKKSIQSFKFEGELVAGYASLLTNTPSNFSIEALEDSVVALLPFKKMTELYDEDPSWERLGRKVAEQHFLNKEAREASFLMLDAKTRYLNLIKERPTIIKRIPQCHIASFLGITASAFNRLVKGLK